MQLIDRASDKNGGIKVAMTYSVNYIPAIFILDADKKIVARNLHGAELDQKIEELLGLW